MEYVEDPEESSSEELDSVSSLDPCPEAHRLNDFYLEDRIAQAYEWDPERKFSHIKYLKGLLGITNEGVREQGETNEQNISTEGLKARYFLERIMTGADHRTHVMFAELLSRQQRIVTKRRYPSLIAIQETQELA